MKSKMKSQRYRFGLMDHPEVGHGAEDVAVVVVTRLGSEAPEEGQERQMKPKVKRSSLGGRGSNYNRIIE